MMAVIGVSIARAAAFGQGWQGHRCRFNCTGRVCISGCSGSQVRRRGWRRCQGAAGQTCSQSHIRGQAGYQYNLAKVYSVHFSLTLHHKNINFLNLLDLLQKQRRSMLRPYERRVRIDFCKRFHLLDDYELAKFQTGGDMAATASARSSIGFVGILRARLAARLGAHPTPLKSPTNSRNCCAKRCIFLLPILCHCFRWAYWGLVAQPSSATCSTPRSSSKCMPHRQLLLLIHEHLLHPDDCASRAGVWVHVIQPGRNHLDGAPVISCQSR